MAISSRNLNEGERILVSTRTHAKALFLPVVALVVVLALAFYLNALPSGDNAAVWRWILWGVTLVLLGFFVLAPFLRWWTRTYTFTDRRLITRQGVLRRRGHDVPLNRISDISFDRGVTDRLLGCGTLVISDASEHGRVELHDIPHVERTQLRLNDELFHGSRRTHDGS